MVRELDAKKKRTRKKKVRPLTSADHTPGASKADDAALLILMPFSTARS
jgi:hypothetical protein